MPDLSAITTLATSKKLWYIIIALAAFIGVAIYVYSYYIAPTLQPAYVPNKEFEKEKTTHAQINLFYVDWCPHSKEALPEWEKIKKRYHNIRINNTMVHFIAYDCEKEAGKRKADELNVKGYPTIILEKINVAGKKKEKERIEFDAKPDFATLEEFLNTVI